MPSSNPYDPNTTSTPSTTESRILETFLLHPSPLPIIIPLPQFTTLFPKAQQSHPQIRTLYRALQLQRNLDLETVRANIEREIARGVKQRVQLLRQVNRELQDSQGVGVHEPLDTTPYTNGNPISTVGTRNGATRRDDEAHVDDPEGDPTETALDAAMFAIDGQLSNLPSHSAGTFHTLPSLLVAMRSAVSDLEREEDELRSRADQSLDEMREVVGGLSDLRYGRFGKRGSDDEGMEELVERELERFVEVCDKKMDRDGSI